MANLLLDFVSPELLMQDEQPIELKENLEQFGRLVRIVEADMGKVSATERPANYRMAPVNVALNIGWHAESKTVPQLCGSVTAALALQCQRCLEPFVLPVSTRFEMLLVNDDGVIPEADEAEVWNLDKGRIRIADIAEEAILMAMPLAAKHESIEQCGPLVEKSTSEAEVARTPFADLRSRMDKLN